MERVMRKFDTLSLEFDRVIDLIRSTVRSPYGKEAVARLNPERSPDELKVELPLLSELRNYIYYDGTFHFEDVPDLRPLLENLSRKSAFLEPEELNALSKNLSLRENLRHELENNPETAEKYPLIEAFLNELPSTSALKERIERLVMPDGSIRESASPELKRIRSRKTEVRQEIQKSLNQLMDRPDYGEMVQDRLITLKEGRFVIPVKIQYKNKVAEEHQSIIHSFSNSRETAFVEPREVISKNNEIIELDDLEYREIVRLLTELSEFVRSQGDTLSKLPEWIGRLESMTARIRFMKEYKAYLPENIEDSAVLELVDARHPLIGKNAVPISLNLNDQYRGMVLSGPNAGGKTAAIKTAGLFCMMAMSGIPLPASPKSRIGRFSSILVEIGDEQNLERQLSSFSGHIRALCSILETANPDSLVLIDEIASSTDPVEGEAIGCVVAQELVRKGCKFIITTHYRGLKELARSEAGLQNASVAMDETTFKPLYTLRPQEPASSFALQAARKYGFPEKLIEEADLYLKNKMTRSERLETELEREKNKAERLRHDAESTLSEALQLKQKFEQQLAEIEKQQKEKLLKLIEEQKSLFQEELNDLLRLKDDLKAQKNVTAAEIERHADSIAGWLESEEHKNRPQIKKPPLQEPKPGEKVWVEKYRKKGVIEQISNGKAQVRIGLMLITIPLKELFADESSEEQKKTASVSKDVTVPPLILDVRGKRAEEALKLYEKNIDACIIHGTPLLMVIHGKGNGILKQILWDYLKEMPQVTEYRYAPPEEGGEGKTLVFF